MLGIDNFLKHFILFSLTLILMVNIVYAFNLVGALGLPSSVSGMTGDFSNKYFGVSTLIDSFKIYFNEESNIPKFQYALNEIYKVMESFNVNNLLKFTDTYNFVIPTGVKAVLGLLGTIINLLVNLPYITMTFVYVTLYFFYVIYIIFTFLSYSIYLLNGYFASTMPNTQFPDVEDIINGTWTALRCILI